MSRITTHGRAASAFAPLFFQTNGENKLIKGNRVASVRLPPSTPAVREMLNSMVRLANQTRGKEALAFAPLFFQTNGKNKLIKGNRIASVRLTPGVLEMCVLSVFTSMSALRVRGKEVTAFAPLSF